jgi:RPA family protein
MLRVETARQARQRVKAAKAAERKRAAAAEEAAREADQVLRRRARNALGTATH